MPAHRRILCCLASVALVVGAQAQDDETESERAGRAHLAAGRIREALAEFRRLNAAHPKEIRYQTEIAYALLRGRLGEAARAVARRCVAAEPGSALAHRALGDVLSYDLFGRPYGPGWDAAGAEAAYRTAKRLDPGDATIRANLALVLEQGTDGERYGTNARLEAAIDEYRELRELGARDYDDELLEALGRAQRFEELRALSPLDPTPEREAWILAARAVSDGADLALAESLERLPDAAARSAALARASQKLTFLRKYSEAAALLGAGAAARGDATRARAAEVIAKTRRSDDLLAHDDPRSAVFRYFDAMLRGAERRSLLESMLTRDFRELALEELLAKAERRVAAMVRDPSYPPDVAFDLFVNTDFSMSVEGDDATGYRVRTSAGARGESWRGTAFVLREDGAYKIAGLDRDLDGLGAECLRRIDAGRTEASRRLLDWAREQIQPRGADDPLAGSPFPRLWDVGAPADAAKMRSAAASLMVFSPACSRAVDVLARSREAATDDETGLALDTALAFGLRSLGRFAELEPVATRLRARFPQSVTAFSLAGAALADQGRWTELERLCEQRLQLVPEDPPALRALARAAADRGDPARAEALYRTVIETGLASPVDYNNLAWSQLVRGSVTEKTMLAARQAVELAHADTETLHTLAAVAVELGLEEEARDALVRSIDASAGGEPSAGHWYVFGRLAEDYGEPEIAASLYRRVQPADPRRTTDDWELAKKRLAAIGAAAARSSTGR